MKTLLKISGIICALLTCILGFYSLKTGSNVMRMSAFLFLGIANFIIQLIRFKEEQKRFTFKDTYVGLAVFTIAFSTSLLILDYLF